MNIVDLDKLCERFWDGNFMEIHKDDIPSIPSAFEGMTNGEVFQAIFPCDEVHVNGLQEGCVHFSMKSNPDSMDCFSLEWWNRPYQEGGEK